MLVNGRKVAFQSLPSHSCTAKSIDPSPFMSLVPSTKEHACSLSDCTASGKSVGIAVPVQFEEILVKPSLLDTP